MNDLTDSRGKWALESESKPEIQENHLHHKVNPNPIKWLKTQNLLEANKFFSCGQSVQFY